MFAGHRTRRPVPISERVLLRSGSHLFDSLAPTAADDQSVQRQHFFGVIFEPEDSVPFQPKIDDSADKALNGATTQEETAPAKVGVVQSARFAVALEVTQFRLQIRIGWGVIGNDLQLLHDGLPFSVAKSGTKIAVQGHSLCCHLAESGQRQGGMMHGMARIESLVNGDLFRNSCLNHDMIDAIPDPDRPVTHKCETECLGRSLAIQVHGHEFGHGVGARKRTVYRHFRLLLDPSFLIVDKDCHQLWLTPFAIKGPLRNAT